MKKLSPFANYLWCTKIVDQRKQEEAAWVYYVSANYAPFRGRGMLPCSFVLGQRRTAAGFGAAVGGTAPPAGPPAGVGRCTRGSQGSAG